MEIHELDDNQLLAGFKDASSRYGDLIKATAEAGLMPTTEQSDEMKRLFKLKVQLEAELRDRNLKY